MLVDNSFNIVWKNFITRQVKFCSSIQTSRFLQGLTLLFPFRSTKKGIYLFSSQRVHREILTRLSENMENGNLTVIGKWRIKKYVCSCYPSVILFAMKINNKNTRIVLYFYCVRCFKALRVK